jgi:hypothetical protein
MLRNETAWNFKFPSLTSETVNCRGRFLYFAIGEFNFVRVIFMRSVLNAQFLVSCMHRI